MSEVKIPDSWRNAMDGLKTAVLSQNESAIAKINNRLDEIEFGVKKATQSPAGVKSSEDMDRFREGLKAYAAFGRNMDAELANYKFSGKSAYDRKGTKSTMVRFDVEAGGALIPPTEYVRELNRQVVEITDILGVANIRRTSLASVTLPKRNTSLEATRRGETQSSTASRDGYGQDIITPKGMSAFVEYTFEEWNDNAFDLDSEISMSMIEQFARRIGRESISGDGVLEMEGMVGRVTNFSPAGLTITAPKLISLKESVKSAYQRNGGWMFSRQTRALIRALTATTSGLDYLWQPGIAQGTPPLLLGDPVYESPDLANPANTGAFTDKQVPVLYGDFRRGYTIVEKDNDYIVRDESTGASEATIKLYHHKFNSGKVTRSEAVAQLEMNN
jgi:HK97 family phage major capsid protein